MHCCQKRSKILSFCFSFRSLNEFLKRWSNFDLIRNVLCVAIGIKSYQSRGNHNILTLKRNEKEKHFRRFIRNEITCNSLTMNVTNACFVRLNAVCEFFILKYWPRAHKTRALVSIAWKNPLVWMWCWFQSMWKSFSISCKSMWFWCDFFLSSFFF